MATHLTLPKLLCLTLYLTANYVFCPLSICAIPQVAAVPTNVDLTQNRRIVEQFAHERYRISNTEAATPTRLVPAELDQPNQILDIPTIPQSTIPQTHPRPPRSIISNFVIGRLAKAFMKWKSEHHTKEDHPPNHHYAWEDRKLIEPETELDKARREWLMDKPAEVKDSYGDEKEIVRKAVTKYGLIAVATVAVELGVDAGVITAIVEHEKKKGNEGDVGAEPTGT